MVIIKKCLYSNTRYINNIEPCAILNRIHLITTSTELAGYKINTDWYAFDTV